MNIEIVIKNKIASPTSDQRIVCGNSDYTITFQFDAEWDVEPVKTVRFTYRRHGRTYYKDQEFTGNTVPVPVLTRIHSVAVGVYAGNLRTTTPARITCTPSILCSDPSLEEDHPLPWVELRNDIGSLSDLNTSDKSSLVAAINEVLARGGSAWIDPEDVERFVEEYLTENPPPKGNDGVSPSVSVHPIIGGHRVTIVDANGTQQFDVLDGGGSSGSASLRLAEIELLAANWQGNESLYSQVVEVAGVTEYSQVDLTPSVEQLVVFYEKDLTFVTENEDGTVTVYAIGQKPENDYIVQATVKEVIV